MSSLGAEPISGLMSRISPGLSDPFDSPHSSDPSFPSSAAKMSLLSRTAKSEGEELSEPGLKSFTCVVPLLVPSVRHSSDPVLPSFAEK